MKLRCQNVDHDERQGPQLSSENDLSFARVFEAFFIHVTTASGGQDKLFEGGFEFSWLFFATCQAHSRN